MRIQRVTTIEALSALRAEWEELDARTYPRLPFTTPDWNLLWWKHFHQHSLSVSDRLYAHSFWGDDGKLCGMAPMVITEQPSFGPLRCRKLQFFGADANLTEVRGLVCAPGDEAAIVKALAVELTAHSGDWDFCRWRGLRTKAAFDALVDEYQGSPIGTITDFYLEPSRDQKSTLPRNVKESLRKCYNSLKRDKLEFTFRAVSAEAEVGDALGVLFRLHRARALLEGTVTHGDVFRSQLARSFTADFVQSMAKQGRVRIFQLVIGNEVVASRLGFVLGSELYLYFSGYDPEYSKYSVMTTTVWEIFQYALENGLSTVNLSPGRDVSKTRWRPHELDLKSAVTVSPNYRGNLTHRAYLAVDQARKSPMFATLLGALKRRV